MTTISSPSSSSRGAVVLRPEFVVRTAAAAAITAVAVAPSEFDESIPNDSAPRAAATPSPPQRTCDHRKQHWVATGDMQGRVTLWNTATKRPVRSFVPSDAKFGEFPVMSINQRNVLALQFLGPRRLFVHCRNQRYYVFGFPQELRPRGGGADAAFYAAHSEVPGDAGIVLEWSATVPQCGFCPAVCLSPLRDERQWLVVLPCEDTNVAIETIGLLSSLNVAGIVTTKLDALEPRRYAALCEPTAAKCGSVMSMAVVRCVAAPIPREATSGPCTVASLILAGAYESGHICVAEVAAAAAGVVSLCRLRCSPDALMLIHVVDVCPAPVTPPSSAAAAVDTRRGQPAPEGAPNADCVPAAEAGEIAIPLQSEGAAAAWLVVCAAADGVIVAHALTAVPRGLEGGGRASGNVPSGRTAATSNGRADGPRLKWKLDDTPRWTVPGNATDGTVSAVISLSSGDMSRLRATEATAVSGAAGDAWQWVPLLLVGDTAGRLALRDAESGQLVAAVAQHAGSTVAALAVARVWNGRQRHRPGAPAGDSGASMKLACGAYDGTLSYWEVPRLERMKIIVP